jgi:hypothetical protein
MAKYVGDLIERLWICQMTKALWLGAAPEQLFFDSLEDW